MKAGNLAILKNYIEKNIYPRSGAEYFIYCDALTLIAKSRSAEGFRYPFLHMSQPNVVPHNNGFGHQTTVFYCEFACMDKVDLSKKNTAQQDAEVLRADSAALDILLEVERLLRVAKAKGDLDVSLNSEIDPIPPKWIDNHRGYLLSVKITLAANSTECN